MIGAEDQIVILVESQIKSPGEFVNFGRIILETMEKDQELRVYCLAFCEKNSLPRSKDKSINIERTRTMFDLGEIKLHYVRMNCRNTIVDKLQFVSEHEALNYPQKIIEPSLMNPLQFSDGNRIGGVAGGSGGSDSETGQELLAFDSLSRLLMWRVQAHPQECAYMLLDAKGKEVKSWSFKKLSLKVAHMVEFI
jgi:hypothetical protein